MKNKNLKNKIIHFIFLIIFLLPLFFIINHGISFTNHDKDNIGQTKQISKQESVAINISGKLYKINIPEGSSALDAMKVLERENPSVFSFISENFPGMGAFVESINGIKGGEGGYWIYYVNNMKASVGVSKYILKPGDVITWKQESSI